jgi:CheY-like chemotaxis protein/predicted transcriptional regulator
MATTPSSAGRSFSADVLSRILTILHQEGATKKTNLAGKTRLNYLTCLKYLELLKSLGLVNTTYDHDNEGERISISEFGLRFNTNLIAYLQKASANESEYHYFNGEKNVAEFLQNDLTSITSHEDIDEDGKNVTGKIMLVDDEKDILFTYKLFLSEGGFEVDVFSDPAEALRQIALSPAAYQLVITDIRMSSINGLQLYHGIRALNQNIKIIFLSALDAADELVSVLPGMNKQFILKKPVNKEMFTKAVALAMQTNGKKILSTLQQ